MTTVQIGELALRGVDVGSGSPVVFQHGLGGSEAQVAESFPSTPGLRRLTLECRGHGTSALGPVAELSVARFAQDVLAFVDSRGVTPFAAGGISMGAAIALRLAALVPELLTALALVRPSWVDTPAPPNLMSFQVVAPYLRLDDPAQGWADFRATAAARDLRERGPDNLASLEGFFRSPRRLDLADLAERITASGPEVPRERFRTLTLPVLVIGNGQDAVHPLATAQELAHRIPGARLEIVPSKARDKAAYLTALHAVLGDFFTAHAGPRG